MLSQGCLFAIIFIRFLSSVHCLKKFQVYKNKVKDTMVLLYALTKSAKHEM